MTIESKVALITGCSSGIGRDLAQRMTGVGAQGARPTRVTTWGGA